MQKTVLITGGFGFLGRIVAARFRAGGCRVIGIGRGHWAPEEAFANGFDLWLNAGVTLPALMTLGEDIHLVVHCAGNGSVGYSLTNPLQDFNKTVRSTAELLEFLRLTASSALVIYPSSAGVYGAKDDTPISEDAALNPISPYGRHKRLAEELLSSYAQSYGIPITIIRFFSIYGPGLTKQLLWDACAKLTSAGTEPAVFWGTGAETRDWISSRDAANLVWVVAQSGGRFTCLNGASGIRTTVWDTISLLNRELGCNRRFAFNGEIRAGDPLYYHANIGRAQSLGWTPSVSLPEGIKDYVSWLTRHQGRRSD